MRCPDCGTENREDAPFCNLCKRTLRERPASSPSAKAPGWMSLLKDEAVKLKGEAAKIGSSVVKEAELAARQIEQTVTTALAKDTPTKGAQPTAEDAFAAAFQMDAPLRAVGDALVDATPERWKDVYLVLTLPAREVEIGGSGKAPGESILIGRALRRALVGLEQAWERDGRQWRSMRIELREGPDGKWAASAVPTY